MIIREISYEIAFLTEEPKMPQINWKLTDERKNIGKFRGRIYEAWFTPDIPIQDGPWKLQGLPGLILEGFDQTKEVQFLFKSIQIPAPATVDIKIEPPTTGRKVDFETYKKADDIAFEEWKKKIESRDYRRGSSIILIRDEDAKKHRIELEYEK